MKICIKKYIVLFSFLILIFSNVSIAEQLTSNEKITSTPLSCGSAINDNMGQLICCYSDEKLSCEDSGECSCDIDRFCQEECDPEGTCGEKPSC